MPGEVQHSPAPQRREFLRAAFGALSLPGLFRLRAEAAPPQGGSGRRCWSSGCTAAPATWRPTTPSPTPRPSTAAPSSPIATRVPGVRVSELLPRHARVAHRFTLLRSLAHTGPCHDSGPQQLFTGFPITVNRLKPDHPDLFAIVDRLRADPSRPLPNNVGVPPIPYLGCRLPRPGPRAVRRPRRPERPALRGAQHRPEGPPSSSTASAAGCGLRERLDRLSRRADQLGEAGRVRRVPGAGLERPDRPAGAPGVRPEPGAGPACATATGGTAWGQRCLLARRLVEAGVDLVSVTLNGPLCGRVQQLGRPRRQPPRLRRHEVPRPVLRPGGRGPDRGPARPRPGPAGAAGGRRRLRPDAADLLRGQQRRRGGQRGGRGGAARPGPLAARHVVPVLRRRHRGGRR